MGALRFSVHTEGLDALSGKLKQACSKAEHTVAEQIRSDTRPFVPMLTGLLDARTEVKGGTVVYPGPYARYLYFGKVMVDENGNGPMRIVGEDGTETLRFHKGAKLHPIDRELKYTRQHHKNAQSYWFEASKAKNLKTWESVAAKAVAYELK